MWKMKNLYLTISIFFLVHGNVALNKYFKPVTNFKQLISRENYVNPYKRYLMNHTIQLSWDYVSAYSAYILEWWTDDDKFYHDHHKKIYNFELAKTRLEDVEYYSFVDNRPGVYVYYFQIRGCEIGFNSLFCFGIPSNILKCLKPYKGQPFPLNGLMQLFNRTSSIHLKWQIPNENHTINHYKIIYCLLQNCNNFTVKESVTSTNEFFIHFDTNPQPLARYKVSVYGVTNDVIKDNWAKRQAKYVIARPWFVGQPKELQDMSQMRSRYPNSLTLYYQGRRQFNTTTKVEVFLNGSKVDCNFEVHSNHISLPPTFRRRFIEITDLPLSNAVYGIEVYQSNIFGDGYRKRFMFSPNLSILTGLPTKVSELTLWVSNESSWDTLTIRWRSLTQLEAGFLVLEGYVITYSESGSNVRRSEKYQNFLADGKYQIFTIRSLQPNKTYTVSVCGYNRYGSGAKSGIFNLYPASKVKVLPRQVAKIYQEQNLDKRKLIFHWYTKEYEGAILPTIEYKIALKRRGCSDQVVTVPARAYKNTAVITIKCRLKDDDIRQSLNISVTITGRNSYALGRPSVPFQLITGFLRMSSPSNFRLVSCRDKVILSWSDIREEKKGYCISHQSKKDNIWNPCCMKYPAVQIKGDMEDDEFAPKLRRNSDGFITFEQKLIPHKSFKNMLGSCQIPVYGTLKFTVSAFNDLGTGYSAMTGYLSCRKTLKHVKSSGQNKPTMKIILVCVAYAILLFLIVIGIFVWRFKHVWRGSVIRIFNSVNPQAVETTNDYEMFSFAPHKLPTYEEAILDTPTGPPPTFEESMSLTGDVAT